MIARLGLPRETRRHFWRVVYRCLLGNPRSLRSTMSQMALYVHFGPFARYVAAETRESIARELLHPSPVASPPRPRTPARLPSIPAAGTQHTQQRHGDALHDASAIELV